MTTRRKQAAPRPAQAARPAPSESAPGTPAEDAAAKEPSTLASPAGETAESPQASFNGGDGASGTAKEPAAAASEKTAPDGPAPNAAGEAVEETPAALSGVAPDGITKEASPALGETAGEAPQAAVPSDGTPEKTPCADDADRPCDAEGDDTRRALERACPRLPVDGDAPEGIEETGPDAETQAASDAPCGEAVREGSSLAVMEDSLRHGRRVAVFAATLFEDLMELHGLSDEWGHRLHHAALLHDIGFVEGKKGHHKASMRLIEENADLGLPEGERPFVALLARYHRKAWPSRRHARFAALKKRDRDALRKAAAILRIADALDYGHAGAVGPLAVTVRKRRVILAIQCRSDCTAEVRRVGEKSDLFRHVFGRKLECLSLRD